MAPVVNIHITRGETFSLGYLVAETDLIYKQIIAMPSKAPVRLTITGHGMPEGWPFTIECVKAPAELNSAEDDYYSAKVIDADTIELNGVNAHCLRAFSGSGVAVFRTPSDLTGWSCKAQVRKKAGGELLYTWSSNPDDLPDSPATVDVAGSQFVLSVSDEEAALITTWKRGVYDFEATDPNGNTIKLTAISQVTIGDEVTE